MIHGYGGSTSPDTRASRVRSIAIEESGGTPPPAVTVADYAFTGWSIPVTIEYAVPGVRLDRHSGDNGISTAGSYAGYDRFGRVLRQKWVDAAYGPHASVGRVPNIPAIVSLGYGNDRSSSRTSAYDLRTKSQWPMSHQYTYDNLERLAEARRGVWSQAGSTFTVGDQSQKWTLDPLGNWNSFWASANPDPFGPGLFPSVLREDRAHNEVNELIERSLPDAGGDLDLEYDAAGNLTKQVREKTGGGTETIEYTWDAWNRLVRVEIDTELRSESEYNGLTHRTVQRADTTGNGVLDQERRFTYDASWRIAEELIDDDFDASPNNGPDRRVQHVWGNRYIDDLILRRIDDDYDGDYDADWYHLTDVQFSTVAVIEPRTSQNARVHERVTYDAYGRARHHWGHDVNGDGSIRTTGSGSDLGIIQAIRATSFSGSVPIADAAYRTEADVNRDGIINAADESALGSVKTALTYGELSDRTSTGPDSIIGWCGYVFIPETQFYHVRFRVYDTGLGRWKTRDPLGYVDGMGVYEYVRSRPASARDPLGTTVGGSDADGVDWLNFPVSRSKKFRVKSDNAHEAPLNVGDRDYLVYTCRRIPYTCFAHCALRCNQTTFSLLNEDGVATPSLNHEKDAPGGTFTPRLVATSPGRDAPDGLCDCIKMAWALNSDTYEYIFNDCNSNWFVRQMARCCGVELPAYWGSGPLADSCTRRHFKCPYSRLGGPEDFSPQVFPEFPPIM